MNKLLDWLALYRDAGDDAERAEHVEKIRKYLAPPAPNPDFEAADRAAAVLDVPSDNPERPAREAEAERIVREHFGADVRIRPLSELAAEPEPKPVIWRDHPDADARPPPNPDPLIDAVVSVGEPGILSAPGDSGKSYITFELAKAASEALAANRPEGTACGLRVKAGPTLFVSYEDGPGRMAGRFKRLGDLPAHVHALASPEPLYDGGAGGRTATAVPGRQWAALWTHVRTMTPPPALMVIDPAKDALANASTNEDGPPRAFLQALARESAATGTGVLVVAHDTKAARREAKEGGDPGAGAIAGSGSWFDRARGVLYVYREAATHDNRIIQCLKANNGRRYWGARLVERFGPGRRFEGFRFDKALERTEVEAAIAPASPNTGARSKQPPKKDRRRGGGQDAASGNDDWNDEPLVS